MRIIEIKVMRGPNYWSENHKQLIVMKLDLGKWDQIPINQIDGFVASLEKVLPSLISKTCSKGIDCCASKCSKKRRLLINTLESVALELQSLAGIDCDFVETRTSQVKGCYHVIMSYVNENAGVYAAKAAVGLVNNLLNKIDYSVVEDIQELQRLYKRGNLGPSTLSIVKEAERRNIPFTRLNRASLVMLGHGRNQKIICATIASTTSNLAVDLASDKDDTRYLLYKAHIPVPKGTLISEIDELQEAVDEIGFPLVTKPVSGNHGRGITTQIHTLEQAVKGFHEAQKVSEDVIVEQHINGNDYRFLVVNYKLIAVAKRTPAMIVGDNISTVNELVNEINKEENRGEGHEKMLTKILLDEATQAILTEKKLTISSILKTGEILYVKETANLSTGGTAEDVTDKVHPHNIFLAERIARLMNLDICGIDIMATDIDIPITEENGAVLEVNAGPGLRMHLSPAKGRAINVAEPILNMLFPDNASARIPIVAVTGTNGKTTVTRLIAHIAQFAGKHTGFTTTDGIYIDGNNVYLGDCSGPESAATVLRDPIVDYAVLETARGGILRTGLGFDKCFISVVTNVSEDHLGLNDIDTLEQLAKVKAVVPQSTLDVGYAILNADDDLVFEMRNTLKCNIALFSMDASSPRIIEHCDNGGCAAFIENDYFIISKGVRKLRIAEVNLVPLTFSGKCEFMINNILPAILTAFLSNFPVEKINAALNTFIPSTQFTPGRMNHFRFKAFELMVDYAHNPAGYLQMKKYMDQENAIHKTGIISATGDRRDEDIKNIGRYSAQTFNKIIIKHDRDNRGRTSEELSGLLIDGIKEINDQIPIVIISDEMASIQYAIDNANVGEFIFVCAEDIPNTLAYVQQQLELENATVDFVSETLNQVPNEAEVFFLPHYQGGNA